MPPRVSERGALICLRGIIQEHLDRHTSMMSNQSFSESRSCRMLIPQLSKKMRLLEFSG